MHEIRIATDKIEMLATLGDTPSAERIWDALPIESSVNTWGQEIYFSIPVQVDLGVESRDRMEVGELAYWPTGSAFCVFFGKTPASKGDEPRAASPVNPIGRIEGDVKVFRQVRDGETISIERVETEPAAAEPAAAEPVAPKPVAPKPVAPKPAAPKPVEAKPVVAEPADTAEPDVSA